MFNFKYNYNTKLYFMWNFGFIRIIIGIIPKSNNLKVMT